MNVYITNEYKHITSSIGLRNMKECKYYYYTFEGNAAFICVNPVPHYRKAFIDNAKDE